jgi:hypothetical protein
VKEQANCVDTSGALLLFLAATLPCVGAARGEEEAAEEQDGWDGKDWDSSAEPGADLGCGPGGGVPAHAAALCVRGEGAQQEQRREEESAHAALLAEGQQSEEEDPEDPHGVPVPGCAVDEDLAEFHAA